MNVYVYSCLDDFENMEVVKIIDKVFNPFFDPKFMRIITEDSLYIFCRKIVDFCRESNWWYFATRTCATQELFSCFAAMKYGVKSFCPVCLSALAGKLFPFLIKIK